MTNFDLIVFIYVLAIAVGGMAWAYFTGKRLDRQTEAEARRRKVAAHSAE